jgi:hypothetical protein
LAVNPAAEGRVIFLYKLCLASLPISFKHALTRLIHLQNYGEAVEVVVVVVVVVEDVVEEVDISNRNLTSIEI